MALSAYSEILSLVDSDGEIPDQHLEELQQKIDGLIESFVEAKADTAFTKFALKQLFKLRDALLAYRFRGPKALLDVLESVTGAMVGHQEMLKDAKSSQKPAYEKFGNAIVHFNKAISFAEKFSPYAAALTEKVFLQLTEGKT